MKISEILKEEVSKREMEILKAIQEDCEKRGFKIGATTPEGIVTSINTLNESKKYEVDFNWNKSRYYRVSV